MGKSTVFVNGQGISSKYSEAVSISSAPDVCKTPQRNKSVSYTNTAQSADIADGPLTIKVDGGMPATEGSCYAKSTGDEPGSKGGVQSGTVGGKAEPVNCSFDVKFEGKGAFRNGDSMTMNNKNTVGVNYDSAAGPPSTEVAPEEVDPGTFRMKVVEHLSWDAYDQDRQNFLLGHTNNKAGAGKKFTITLPDGSKVEKTADANGVIEITGLEPGGKCKVEHKLANAKLNCARNLFYDRITTIDAE